MSYTPFMVSLAAMLVSERGITETSAGQYIRALTTMNNKQGFKKIGRAHV
jgi:hypothetical protein